MIRSLTNTESELLAALRRGDEQAFSQIYRKYYHMVSTFILRNQGTETEARDLFQEVVFILVKKTRQKEFQLTAKLGTFIFSIARNLWLQQLKKRKHAPVKLEEGSEAFMELEANELEVKEAYEKKHELVGSIFKNLKEDCQEIIKASFYQKMSHQEISDLMGYSQAFVRVKLHRCMEGLRKKVRQHPNYQRVS